MKKVIVDISECDIDEFKDVIYRDKTFSWIFPTTDGEDIEIEFVPTPDDTNNIEPYDEEFDR